MITNSTWTQDYRVTRDQLRRAREYLVLMQAQQHHTASAEQRAAFEWFCEQLKDPAVQRQLQHRWPDLVARAKKTGP